MPKCRRKILYGRLRRYLGEGFYQLAESKESRTEERGWWHILMSILPKYVVTEAVGAVHFVRS
ncbi:MAG TPA: hypothetical protein ENJ32_06855 [Crenotrichaceae bacterium]|nr:hypothetical protein [Crenotrichaceae bacterium]